MEQGDIKIPRWITMPHKDPTKFRQRFLAWKNGELVYDKGRPTELPGFRYGTEEDDYPVLSVKNGDVVDTDQCATWSNGWLRNIGYLTHGNAWNLKGVDTLFNGFEGMTKPSTYDRTEIEKYNHAAADSVYKKFDSSTLDKSLPYAVNMFYNGSPAQEEAYKNGDKVTGTHTGVLTFNPTANRWYVTHNIHGKIHSEPFVPLLSGKGKYGVTAIYLPRKKNLVNKVKGLLGFAGGTEGERELDEYDFAPQIMDEVVIKPTKEDWKAVGQMRKIFKDKHNRLAFYDQLDSDLLADYGFDYGGSAPNISSNERVKRFLNVYNSASKPKISTTGSVINKLGLMRSDRANYNPLTNKMFVPAKEEYYSPHRYLLSKNRDTLYVYPRSYISKNKKPYVPYDDVFSELAHAILFYDKHVANGIGSYFEIPGDIKIKGKTGYQRPGHSEYNAHHIIEPFMNAYIVGDLDKLDDMYDYINWVHGYLTGNNTETKFRDKQITLEYRK